MDITIKNNLCKSMRGCGLGKKETHELVNVIEKWHDSNGAQWTVDRLKAYKQWYESILAGSPAPPPWFKHTKDLSPVGIWSRVFKQRNPAKVLAVLSAGTIFQSRKITSPQREKFLQALNAGPLPTSPDLTRFEQGKRVRLPDLTGELLPPGFDAITGRSIPVSSEDGKIFAESEKDKVNAYCASWSNVPLPTLRYLRRERHLEQVPPALLTEGGCEGLFATLPTQETQAGFIGCIQEPGLKARWVANPNRVTQHYLGPLGDHWYKILRSLPTDCTFNQELGISWVQAQLKEGKTLSGADLSSATDLLDRQSCLDLISQTYLGRSWNSKNDWTLPVEISYRSAVDHFMDICSMDWVYPEGGTVSWTRGQPLGTYPSFAMLGLTNNALGRQACLEAGIRPDSFRVIGDDIIMDSRALEPYCRLVESFGGVINHSKTLTSSQCAEFAGRVITEHRSMNKTVKFKEMSDNSFMQIVSDLGDQAKSLLRPRQRRQYDEFKFVPGIIVDGPYPKNSFGIPLELRYAWYLIESGLSKERVVPDKEKYDSWQFASKIYYTLAEEGRLDEFEYSVPYTFADDFQSSLANAVVHKGDPRLRDGKTCLEVLEAISSPDTFMSWSMWIQHESSLESRKRYAERQANEKKLGWSGVEELIADAKSRTGEKSPAKSVKTMDRER